MSTHVMARLVALAALSGLGTVSESALALSFTTVEAGGVASCGISSEQQLWCWGLNVDGVLGTGQAVDAVVPLPRNVGLSDVTVVSIGYNHACAIAGGEAWCWGGNNIGQLGAAPLGELARSLVPIRVGGVLSGRTDVTAISVGVASSCALAGGQLYCWGRGFEGQLGNGSVTSTGLPSQAWIAGATQVAAGDSHACAIAQGKVWCWGGGDALGDPAPGPFPAAVAGIPNGVLIEHIAAGPMHSCAAAANHAWCWGNGANGKLGNGNAQTSYVAVPVAWNHGATIIDIDAGGKHTCAIDADGRAWCWGSDDWGQLGDGAGNNDMSVPTPVYSPYGSNVTSLSAGIEYTCGVAGGLAHCWGRNMFGQLGLGTFGWDDYRHQPYAVDTDRLFDTGFDLVVD